MLQLPWLDSSRRRHASPEDNLLSLLTLIMCFIKKVIAIADMEKSSKSVLLLSCPFGAIVSVR